MLSVRRSFVSLRLVSPSLPSSGESPPAHRSYGRRGAGVQVPARTIALAAVLLGGVLSCVPSWGLASSAASAEGPVRIVALGDSLTAGFGLPGAAAFPVKLEKALTAKGLAVEIGNAGVSG